MSDCIETFDEGQTPETAPPSLVPADASPLLAESATVVVARATEVANVGRDIIGQRRLYSNIQGKPHVNVTGWTTVGAMCGIVAREVEVTESEDGTFTAVVELVRLNDQAVVGRASAMVDPTEPNWRDKPRYARRSMAVTRATGKAFRLALGWIMKLAGYEPTCVEEMPFPTDAPHVSTGSTGDPVTAERPPPQVIEVDVSSSARGGDLCSEGQQDQARDIVDRLGWTSEQARELVQRHGADRLVQLTQHQCDKLIAELQVYELEGTCPF